jgi:hypothetical protein
MATHVLKNEKSTLLEVTKAVEDLKISERLFYISLFYSSKNFLEHSNTLLELLQK